MANHLAVLRKNAGYKSAKAAALRIGCSWKTIYALENGFRKPSPELAAKITKIYHCTFDDIFLPYDTTKSCI